MAKKTSLYVLTLVGVLAVGLIRAAERTSYNSLPPPILEDVGAFSEGTDAINYFSDDGYLRTEIEGIVNKFLISPNLALWAPVQEISEEHPYFFFHSRRAAGSTLRNNLYDAAHTLGLPSYLSCENGIDCNENTIPHDLNKAIYAVHIKWGDHLKLDQLKSHRRVYDITAAHTGIDNSYSCTANIREPVSRIISCFQARFLSEVRAGKIPADTCIGDLSLKKIFFLLTAVDKVAGSCLNEPFRILSGQSNEGAINNLGMEIDANRTLALPILSHLSSDVLGQTFMHLQQCVPFVLELPEESSDLMAYKFPSLYKGGAFRVQMASNVNRDSDRCPGDRSRPTAQQVSFLEQFAAYERVLYDAVVQKVKAAHAELLADKNAMAAVEATKEKQKDVMKEQFKLQPEWLQAEQQRIYMDELRKNPQDSMQLVINKEYEHGYYYRSYEGQPVRTSFSASSNVSYVTLLDGLGATNDLKYRAMLLNILATKHAFDKFGSIADFVVMYGFHDDLIGNMDPVTAKRIMKRPDAVDEEVIDLVWADLAFLESYGIKLHRLEPFRIPLSDSACKSCIEWEAEEDKLLQITLRKIEAWGLTMYDRVQFLDADIMPLVSMDCFFDMNPFQGLDGAAAATVAAARVDDKAAVRLAAFESGWVSPLNAGWALLSPNLADYQSLRRWAIWRLHQGGHWDTNLGFGVPMPEGLLHSDPPVYWGNRQTMKDWGFYGADLEQGLFVHHFAVAQDPMAAPPDSPANSSVAPESSGGGAGSVSARYDSAFFVQIDSQDISIIQRGQFITERPPRQALGCCLAARPNQKYLHMRKEEHSGEWVRPSSRMVHFVGDSKPWLHNDTDIFPRLHPAHNGGKPGDRRALRNGGGGGGGGGRSSLARKRENAHLKAIKELESLKKGPQSLETSKKIEEVEEIVRHRSWDWYGSVEVRQRLEWYRRLDTLRLNVKHYNLQSFLQSRDPLQLVG